MAPMGSILHQLGERQDSSASLGTTTGPGAGDDGCQVANTVGEGAGDEVHGKLGVAQEVQTLQLFGAGGKAGADETGSEGIGDTLGRNRIADERDATTRGDSRANHAGRDIAVVRGSNICLLKDSVDTKLFHQPSVHDHGVGNAGRVATEKVRVVNDANDEDVGESSTNSAKGF